MKAIYCSPVDWLLDSEYPGVRYLAMHDLQLLSPEAPDYKNAMRAAHQNGPIANILDKMEPAGWWKKPGAGYNPKYFSGVWSLIMLAQMGASISADERIKKASTYMMDNAMTSIGQFTINGAPSGTIDCLQGNLCYALTSLGCTDPRLDLAFDWMARTVTGEGIAPATERDALMRYYAYKCGPGFACGANGRLACAWGASKVLLAFGSLPSDRRTPIIERAIHAGVEFLLSVDPVRAEYPTRTGAKPSRNWWLFGFPLFYVTDLLQIVEVLTSLGWGNDPRLRNAIRFVKEKQDDLGRIKLEYDYNGKTWANFGPKNEPNPWVTLRALRALKMSGKLDK